MKTRRSHSQSLKSTFLGILEMSRETLSHFQVNKKYSHYRTDKFESLFTAGCKT